MAGLILDGIISNNRFYGDHRITGTTSRLGVAGRYNVLCFDKASYRCIASTLSNTDGIYAFNNIKFIDKGYFLIIFDYNQSPVNAAISDLVTPEPMP